jgi:hypothetical protein
LRHWKIVSEKIRFISARLRIVLPQLQANKHRSLKKPLAKAKGKSARLGTHPLRSARESRTAPDRYVPTRESIMLPSLVGNR